MCDREALRQVCQRQHVTLDCAPKPRKPPRFAALAIAAAFALTACGPRDGAYDPSSFHVHDQIVPRDVAVPSAPLGEEAEFNGLYTESSAVLSCCWIAPHARLLVRKHGPARTLVAGFWLPNEKRFDDGQEVTISFPGSRDAPLRTTLSSIGEQYTIKVPVPSNVRARSGLIPVDIACSVEFVARRDTAPTYSLFTFLHLRAATQSTDSRSLGIVLLYLYFQ
jgi:hypothetical protein